MPPSTRPLDVILWTGTAATFVGIVIVSLVPQPAAPPALSDKILHVGAYAVLTGLALLAAVWAPVRGRGRFPDAVPAVLWGALGVGIALEVAQGFFGTRTPDVLDVVTNAVGVCLGAAAWRLAPHRER